MVKRLVLDQILKLDPQVDQARIVHLDSCYEFPFDCTQADEFALYRTYAVPSIANLLDRYQANYQRVGGKRLRLGAGASSHATDESPAWPV